VPTSWTNSLNTIFTCGEGGGDSRRIINCHISIGGELESSLNVVIIATKIISLRARRAGGGVVTVNTVTEKLTGSTGGDGFVVNFTSPGRIGVGVGHTITGKSLIGTTVVAFAAIGKIVCHPAFAVGKFTNLIDFVITLVFKTRALGVASTLGSEKSITVVPFLHGLKLSKFFGS
jgi:hypothetical protein